MAESEGAKESLDGGEKASEKADLNVNIQNTMIVASSLITSWQRDGK